MSPPPPERLNNPATPQVRLAPAGTALLFAVRHGLAMLVMPPLAALLWTIAYFVLLGIAMITGSGLGGPLAWPAGMAFFGAGSFCLIALVLLPACAVAAALRGLAKWPRLVGLPVAMAAAAAITFVWIQVMILSGADRDYWSGIQWLIPAAAACQLPYWILVDGVPGFAAALFERMRRRIFKTA